MEEGCKRPLSVLVVEDNEDAAHSLVRLLNQHGYSVDFALDGPCALRKALEFDPDIILLDLGLPGMDGLDVARKIRKNPSQKRPLFIAITGRDTDDDIRRSKEAGIDLHLVKPADWNALHQLIERFERVIA